MHKKFKYSYLISFCLVIVQFYACKTEVTTPLMKDKTPPASITDPVVENLPGAAKIIYKVPKDDDLLYVKAEWKTKQGLIREEKATYYANNLTLVGFGDSDTYEVKLYAVDKSENSSSPVTVTVKPLKPPYLTVMESITINENFGGIDVEFTNQDRGNIAVVILGIDSLNQFVPINTYYSNLSYDLIRTRNLPAVKSKFGVYIRDRWDNRSDTVLAELTPLFETQLDRTKMKGMALANDAGLWPGTSIEALFDGLWAHNWGARNYQSGASARMPQWFTYDMGVTAKLSRMVWYMREGWLYDLHNPKEVEIWGSNNPTLDGSWDNWVLLAKHTQVKPSGLPNGELSNADVEASKRGETIIFSKDSPEVRYIRFKTLSNWSGGVNVNFNEIVMWGKPQ